MFFFLLKNYNHELLDETVTEDAQINTYLQVIDNEDHIQPSFYSFGSGEAEVQVMLLRSLTCNTYYLIIVNLYVDWLNPQVVDIEPIGEAGSLVMTCAGDTEKREGKERMSSTTTQLFSPFDLI